MEPATRSCSGVRNLTKRIGRGEQIDVLRGVNLDVSAGERVALTGRNPAAARATLLHLIAGLDRATAVRSGLPTVRISRISTASAGRQRAATG